MGRGLVRRARPRARAIAPREGGPLVLENAVRRRARAILDECASSCGWSRWSPWTNIGAAHPVDSSGGDIQGDLRLKAENDAVAHIVNIAKARGRNEQWAEDAVRKSVSIGSDEAVKIGVADVIASDVNDLLVKI